MGLQRMPYGDFKSTPEYKALKYSHENDERVVAWRMYRAMHVGNTLDFNTLGPVALKLWQEKERAVAAYEIELSMLWVRVTFARRRGYKAESKLIWDGEIDDET